MAAAPNFNAPVPVYVPLLNPEEPEMALVSLAVVEGQSVTQGDTLATLQSDHAHDDITAAASGYVSGLRFKPGDRLRFGDVLCYLAPEPPAAPVRSPDVLDPAALLIYGGGGHGKALIDLIRVLPAYRVEGVIDDGLPSGSQVMGAPVLGGESALAEQRQRGVGLAVNAIGGIGNIGARVAIFERLAKAGFASPALVHPAAFVEPSAHLAAGAQVFPHAYVGSEAQIGFGVILNYGAAAGHDAVIGAYTNISPGTMLGGNVTVGERCLIGMNVTINNGVHIGAGSRIGNGANIKRDVPDGAVIRAGRLWPE